MPANRMFFTRLVDQYGEEGSDEIVINETDVAFLAWCGYQNHCLISDITPVFTKGNFIEWVDEMALTEEGKKTLEDVATCYKDSRFTKQYAETVSQEVEKLKKKLTGTPSNPIATES